MAQIGAVFVFCSSCKILCFASSVHPKNATELRQIFVPGQDFLYLYNYFPTVLHFHIKVGLCRYTLDLTQCC